jgi:hypothetical protein
LHQFNNEKLPKRQTELLDDMQDPKKDIFGDIIASKNTLITRSHKRKAV